MPRGPLRLRGAGKGPGSRCCVQLNPRTRPLCNGFMCPLTMSRSALQAQESFIVLYLQVNVPGDSG